MPSDFAPQLPGLLLQRSAEELLNCVASLSRIERAISPLVPQVTALTDHLALQEIDLLGQSLTDISTCLSAMARNLQCAEPIDGHAILAPLRLNDLRNRLGGLGSAVGQSPDCDVLF